MSDFGVFTSMVAPILSGIVYRRRPPRVPGNLKKQHPMCTSVIRTYIHCDKYDDYYTLELSLSVPD